MPQTINYGHSLLLSDDWDLQLDVTGNIATTTGAYAIAQNVANSIRLFTDDASVVEASGHPVKLVSGNRENIKLTTPLDLLVAESLFRQSHTHS